MLLKLVTKEHDTMMQIEKTIAAEPFQIDAQHADVLGAMHEDGTRISREDLAVQLNGLGYEARLPWLGRALNELTRGGFLRRYPSGYSITPRGLALP